MAGIDERTGRRRRARALIRAGGGRMAASAAPLRPLGGRMMLEFNRVHTVVIEHAFTIAERGGGKTWSCWGRSLRSCRICGSRTSGMDTCGICAPRSISRGSGLSHDHLHTAASANTVAASAIAREGAHPRRRKHRPPAGTGVPGVGL
jgi:hypothetical protein